MFHKHKSVRLVSGSWPPEICGVGDFMANVSGALSNQGARAIRTRLSRLGLGAALNLLIGSYWRREEVLYMSYPTEGYGKSLLPFLLALGSRQRIILHLHEYGSKNNYCRILLRRFQRMPRIFFSNAEDFQRYVGDCGLRPDSAQVKGWRVVPTPSNIPISASGDLRDARRIKIVHFGQIRPNKGLEQLALAFEALGREAHLDMLLMGGVPAGYEAYATAIAKSFNNAGATVKLNLTPEEISREFASSHIGVFAFPDGADERRGSLIAAMAHGVLCITTHSLRTPVFIKEASIGLDLQAARDDAMTIANAVRTAAMELHSENNLTRSKKAKEAGAKASFSGIADQILST